LHLPVALRCLVEPTTGLLSAFSRLKQRSLRPQQICLARQIAGLQSSQATAACLRAQLGSARGVS
jgi:hypothetical protein